MTVNEMLQTYPILSYRPSAGENLFSVCRRVYGNQTDQQLAFLVAANRRYDWSCLQAGAFIQYVAPEFIKYFNEIK